MSQNPTVSAELADVLSHIPERPERSPHRARDYTLRRLLACADLIGLAGAWTLSVTYGGQLIEQRIGVLAGLAFLPVWVLLFKLYGLYERDSKRVSHATVDDVPWLFHALVIGSLLFWFYLRGLTPHKPILAEGVLFFISSFTFVFIARAAARRIALRFTAPQRVLFVGDGPIAAALVRKMRAHPEYRLDPVACVEPRSDDDGVVHGLPRAGDLDDIEQICREQRIDRVLIVAPHVDESTIVDAIRRTKHLDLRISIVPQVVDVLGPSVEIDDVEGLTVLGINPPVLTRSSRYLKRTMDLVIASVGLVVVAPLVLVAAIAIKATSKGPVLYGQIRIGRRGLHLRVLKLRTMVANADALAEGLREDSAHPAWLLLEVDPRVTRVGRVLRRTSIDELPQLWNVLRGDMSLVGPRPMPPDAYAHMEAWGHRRLDLTPGITGLWQVLGRTAIPFEEMVKLDYLYVTNWSLWQDVRLLVHTLPAIVGRRGVN